MGSWARTTAAVGTRALAGLAVTAAWTVGTYGGAMIRNATYWPGRKTVGDAINSYLLLGADLSVTAAPETRCGW